MMDPNTVPCGVPQPIVTSPDSLPPTCTVWALFRKKFESTFAIFPLHPSFKVSQREYRGPMSQTSSTSLTASHGSVFSSKTLSHQRQTSPKRLLGLTLHKTKSSLHNILYLDIHFNNLCANSEKLSKYEYYKYVLPGCVVYNCFCCIIIFVLWSRSG